MGGSSAVVSSPQLWYDPAMKASTVLRVGLLAFVVVALASCTFFSDALGLNRFTVDGESYPVSQLWVMYWGANGNGSYDIDVIMASDGLDYDTGGQGDYIYLDLNSPSSSLENGTYSWSLDRNDYTLVYATGWIGRDTSAGTTDDYAYITGGEVTFRKELVGGDHVFRLDLRGEDMNGSPVEVGGYFRGPIDEEEYITLSVAPRFGSAVEPLLEKFEKK